MAGEQTIIGRSKTVLVFGQGPDAKAVVATVLARVRRRRGHKRVWFAGRVVFDPTTVHHLTEAVLATIDRITAHLTPKRKPQAFELSVINIGAAAVSDLGVTLTGFSADAAVLLAVLSAGLKIPLPQDLAVTGHLASTSGDIRPVRGIPEKVAAAVLDPTISRLILPSLDADLSLQTLSPSERQRAADATVAAKGELHISNISDIFQLIQYVFDDRSLVSASLQSGFFGSDMKADKLGDPLQRTVALLADNNEGRFERVLERDLFAREAEKVHGLLLARARYQVRRRRYPHRLGQRLLQLVRSLPPAIRRTDGLFPLLATEQCLRLFRFARSDDYDDVQLLLSAVSGEAPTLFSAADPVTASTSTGTNQAVDWVLNQISAEALAHKIGVAVDLARATFQIGTVVLDSDERFLDTVASFYLTLVRRTGSDRASGDDQTIRSEGFSLLERAFSDKGGADAARAEARHGVHGGMRFVLDAMTERYKRELQINHVKRIVAEAVDPLEWDDRVAFIRALFERIGQHLPPEVRSQPPERYARHYGTIVEMYVQSLDQVKQLLRAL